MPTMCTIRMPSPDYEYDGVDRWDVPGYEIQGDGTSPLRREVRLNGRAMSPSAARALAAALLAAADSADGIR